jgi:hypothetical protein
MTLAAFHPIDLQLAIKLNTIRGGAVHRQATRP